MQPSSVPEVVNYTCQGRTQKALVLKARNGEVSHLGENGEPLLTLAFVKQAPPNAPHKRPTVLQMDASEPEIQIERDVVHASHEFSKEFLEAKNIPVRADGPDAALVATHRGHGEWSEVEDENAFDRAQAWSNCHDAEQQAAEAKREVARLNQLVSDLTSSKDDPPASA